MNRRVRLSQETRDEELEKAISKLPQTAERLVEGCFQANTKDREDHSFSGIAFVLEARTNLPIQYIEIQSVSIRGSLGRMSIYATNARVKLVDTDAYERLIRKVGHRDNWTRIYGPKDIEGDFYRLSELPLDIPIRLLPGTAVGIYVHSEAEGDEAIVYDNSIRRGDPFRYRDNFIQIRTGIAHTSNIPFSNFNHWNGIAWRGQREFVGRIRYGCKYLLWTPINHKQFSNQFQEAVHTLLCCQSHLSKLRGMNFGKIPLDVLYKIINSLPHDWFGLIENDTMEAEEEEEDNDSEEEEEWNSHDGGD